MTKKSLALGTSLLIAGSIALALSAPLAASAHDALIGSTPSENAKLTQLPESFSITMNEPLLVVAKGDGFALQIRDAAGAYYGDGCLVMKDATMSTAAALGEPGKYTMLWQIVSEDGHTVDGEIPFTWKPAIAVDASPSSAAPPVCGQGVDPSPSASASQPPATTPPVAEAPTASAVDLPTVLWIGGALLAAGIAVAIAIVVAGRRKPTP
jgi:copper resistance protein C